MLNKPLKIGRVHRIAKTVYGNLLNANRSYVNTYLMSEIKNRVSVRMNDVFVVLNASYGGGRIQNTFSRNPFGTLEHYLHFDQRNQGLNVVLGQ